MIRAVLLVVLAVLGPSPALAETFDGERAVIIDGDTFALGSERVRIMNIDAPETRGARCEWELVLGLKAKERLAGLLRAGSVDIIRGGEDRYRRTLARVSVGGLDVGSVLVGEGLALPWRDGIARRLNHVENIAQQDSAERAFNKLTRTFTMQMEALKRYRTGGQQKVLVEHVTVNAGGQAIVGSVDAGGGVANRNEGQPHAKALSHAPEPPLWSQDPEREPVPITGDAKR